MESQIGSTESLTTFPAEYWEAEGSVHGALVENVGTNNLVILSSRDIPIGSKLNLRIFYANEYEFDCIKLAANTNWKRLHIEEDWKGYKYGLDFVQISEEEHQELKNLLDGHSPSEEPLERRDVVPIESLPEKSSSPPLPNSDLSTSSTANCKFHKTGKSLEQVLSVTCATTKMASILAKSQARSRELEPVASAFSGQGCPNWLRSFISSLEIVRC